MAFGAKWSSRLPLCNNPNLIEVKVIDIFKVLETRIQGEINAMA